jgi:type II secretion system protein J
MNPGKCQLSNPCPKMSFLCSKRGNEALAVPGHSENQSLVTSAATTSGRALTNALNGSRGQTHLSCFAFTLLELLIAVSIFAIVLAAINAVFYSALRLRNRAAAMVDKALPIENALNIIRHDLLSIVPPGTNLLFGPLQSTSSSNLITTASGPVFYCASGYVDETTPWAEVQRIMYAVIDATNRYEGKDLVRYADRNLLAVTPEPPQPQRLLSGVREISFFFYDGSQWRQYWDTTTDTNLPRGIRVQIQMENDPDTPNAPLPAPLQLVVPVLVSTSTNSITTNSTSSVTP